MVWRPVLVVSHSEPRTHPELSFLCCRCSKVDTGDIDVIGRCPVPEFIECNNAIALLAGSDTLLFTQEELDFHTQDAIQL